MTGGPPVTPGLTCDSAAVAVQGQLQVARKQAGAASAPSACLAMQRLAKCAEL